jgi:hypothetical protein
MALSLIISIEVAITKIRETREKIDTITLKSMRIITFHLRILISLREVTPTSRIRLSNPLLNRKILKNSRKSRKSLNDKWVLLSQRLLTLRHQSRRP